MVLISRTTYLLMHTQKYHHFIGYFKLNNKVLRKILYVVIFISQLQ